MKFAALRNRQFIRAFLAAVVLSLAVGMPSQVGAGASPSGGGNANKNAYFNSFQPYFPGTEVLGPDEMRITFMGTTCIPMLSQAAVSVLVELGNGENFMFDAGTGVTTRFWALGHNMSKMSRIFLAHHHADHMGELPFILGFGPYYGRSGPLYLWGPGRSEFVYTDPDQNRRGPFNDGMSDIADALQAFAIWHTESQSFAVTSYADYKIPDWCTWCDRNPETAKIDAYDVVPRDLPWRNTGYVDGRYPADDPRYHAPGPGDGITSVEDNIAYDDGSVRITHFPAVHTRAAAVSYRLDWKDKGLSMIYAGDTLPNNYMLGHASGVDVLVHEIVMPADVWNQKMGVASSNDQWAQLVQDSSHTPEKAFGYILNQLGTKPSIAPRLAVGTHFQATDDTIKQALQNIRLWYPKGDVVIASDFMVITVSKTKMDVRRGVVSEHAWPQAAPSPFKVPNHPKYWIYDSSQPTGWSGDPTAQLDPAQDAQVIDPDIYNAR